MSVIKIRKRKAIIIVFLLAFIYILLVSGTVVYSINYGKSIKEVRFKCEEIFKKYESKYDAAITYTGVLYNDHSISLLHKVYSNDLIAFANGVVYYIIDYKDFFKSYRLEIYAYNFIDEAELIFSINDIPSSPIIKIFDDEKFFIMYFIRERPIIASKTMIVDVFDIYESKYYNYSRDEKRKIDEIVLEEQKEKYHLDIKLSKDKKSFICHNIYTDSITIIDDAFINDSSFSEEMNLVDYKACKAYISNGDILLVYNVGLNGKYVASVTYKYVPDSNDITFVSFDYGKAITTRYVLRKDY